MTKDIEKAKELAKNLLEKPLADVIGAQAISESGNLIELGFLNLPNTKESLLAGAAALTNNDIEAYREATNVVEGRITNPTIRDYLHNKLYDILMLPIDSAAGFQALRELPEEDRKRIEDKASDMLSTANDGGISRVLARKHITGYQNMLLALDTLAGGQELNTQMREGLKTGLKILERNLYEQKERDSEKKDEAQDEHKMADAVTGMRATRIFVAILENETTKIPDYITPELIDKVRELKQYSNDERPDHTKAVTKEIRELIEKNDPGASISAIQKTREVEMQPNYNIASLEYVIQSIKAINTAVGISSSPAAGRER